MRLRVTPLLSVLIAVAALAGGYGVARWLVPVPAPQTVALGGDFTLTSARGPVSLEELRGHVVPIYFGYSFCPDACPTSLTSLGLAIAQLSAAQREQVQPLFISVDPARDTPIRLAEYVTHFSPRMLGLTGTPEEVAAVARKFAVYYAVHRESGDDANYLVDHTSRIYVVGRDGRVLLPLEHGTPPARIAEVLREALS